MKNLILLFSLLCFTFSACNKEDQTEEKEPFIHLEQSEIFINYGTIEQLTISDNFTLLPGTDYTWETEDYYIARVGPEGNVEGISIGETNIIVTSLDESFSATCKVNVTPVSNLYEEPDFLWFESKEKIKAAEKRTLTSEEEYGLIYAGTGNEDRIEYQFENDGLASILIVFKETEKTRKEIYSFIEERYPIVTVECFVEDQDYIYHDVDHSISCEINKYLKGGPPHLRYERINFH